MFRFARLSVPQPGFKPVSFVATTLQLSANLVEVAGIQLQCMGSGKNSRSQDFWKGRGGSQSQKPYSGAVGIQEGVGHRGPNRGKLLALLVRLLLGSRWLRQRWTGLPGFGPQLPPARLLGACCCFVGLVTLLCITASGFICLRPGSLYL